MIELIKTVILLAAAVYVAYIVSSNPVEKRVKIARIIPEAKLPTRATDGSSGYDLYTTEAIALGKGRSQKIRTGLIMEIPLGYRGEIVSRSGLGSKGIQVAVGVNIIDSDYRGEVFVNLKNTSEETWYFDKGDRMAQIVFDQEPALRVSECFPAEITFTKRGNGGFGSTGVK